MDLSIDKVETACGAVYLCVFLRRFWPYTASGKQKSTSFYGPAGVRGAQSAVFLRIGKWQEFQDHVFLQASGPPGAPDVLFSRLLSAFPGVSSSG